MNKFNGQLKGQLHSSNKSIDFLPAIAINVDLSPKEFLERMAVLANKSATFQIQFFTDGMSMDIVDFLPKDNIEHVGLYGQLIYEHDREDRIRVEIRALAWKPEHPTKEIYLTAAHFVFDDLIKAYNFKYKKRYKMRIVKEKYPNLPPKASIALNDFTYLANKKCLHPLDWGRLYKFARVCHATRTKPPKELICGILIKEGFSPKNADHIADIASHLLDFMKSK